MRGGLYLTKEEERILSGEEGEERKWAMETIVALGEVFGAERLVKISSSQVSGVSPKTIGKYGLKFLRRIRNAKVSVLTTLNPCGVDLKRKEEFPKDFVKEQEEILEIYKGMGILPSCTCTPYLVGNTPSFGEVISWAESSAVVFANSVLGARTNREGGPSALASAIIGKTPEYGLIIEEEREPQVLVKVKTNLNDEAEFGALGYSLGKLLKDEIPLIDLGNRRRMTLEEHKQLGAGIATSSEISIYHVRGQTPEALRKEMNPTEKIEIGEEEINQVFEDFSESENGPLVVGCPHMTLREAEEAKRFRGKVLAYASRCVASLVKDSENFKIYGDTCMVVSPLREMGIEEVLTPSVKAAFYMRNLSGIRVSLIRKREALNEIQG